MKKILLMMLLSAFFISCSESNEDLTSSFWVKYKKSQPNYLVKFGTDGKFVNFNKLTQTYTYQVIQNRIIITDSKGEKQKFFIKSISPTELKLSEINDAGSLDIDYFRKAEATDFFLGTWIKISKGNHYILTLLANGKGLLEEEVNGYIGQKEIKYTVKQKDVLAVDDKLFEYKFSDDLINLELIDSDKNVLTLTREK